MAEHFMGTIAPNRRLEAANVARATGVAKKIDFVDGSVLEQAYKSTTVWKALETLVSAKKPNYSTFQKWTEKYSLDGVSAPVFIMLSCVALYDPVFVSACDADVTWSDLEFAQDEEQQEEKLLLDHLVCTRRDKTLLVKAVQAVRPHFKSCEDFEQLIGIVLGKVAKLHAAEKNSPAKKQRREEVETASTSFDPIALVTGTAACAKPLVSSTDQVDPTFDIDDGVSESGPNAIMQEPKPETLVSPPAMTSVMVPVIETTIKVSEPVVSARPSPSSFFTQRSKNSAKPAVSEPVMETKVTMTVESSMNWSSFQNEWGWGKPSKEVPPTPKVTVESTLSWKYLENEWGFRKKI